MSSISSPRPRTVGIAGGVLLMVLFLAILTVSESWAHAWERLEALWPWILLLSTGFGLQAGLFWYIRQVVRRRRAQGVATVAASGGVSTGAMVACCLHHGSDVLPIVGLSALAPFLTRYQPFFLTLGVMANLFSISVMLMTVKGLGLYQPGKGILGRLARLDLRLVRNGILLLSLLVLSGVLWTSCSGRGQPLVPATPATPASSAPVPAATPAPAAIPTPPAARALRAQAAEANGLTVAVSPEGFTPGSPLRFAIAFDTHQGSLDFDIAQVAVVEDSLGNRYRALSWEGMPAGGHHRSGTLTFPATAPATRWIKLTFYGLYGVPERTFRWGLE